MSEKRYENEDHFGQNFFRNQWDQLVARNLGLDPAVDGDVEGDLLRAAADEASKAAVADEEVPKKRGASQSFIMLGQAITGGPPQEVDEGMVAQLIGMVHEQKWMIRSDNGSTTVLYFELSNRLLEAIVGAFNNPTDVNWMLFTESFTAEHLRLLVTELMRAR